MEGRLRDVEDTFDGVQTTPTTSSSLNVGPRPVVITNIGAQDDGQQSESDILRRQEEIRFEQRCMETIMEAKRREFDAQQQARLVETRFAELEAMYATVTAIQTEQASSTGIKWTAMHGELQHLQERTSLRQTPGAWRRTLGDDELN